MRKDYMADTGRHDSEIEFVERHWTKIWEQEGGPKGRFSRIRRSDEYRVIRPWLEKLGRGSRLLDAGCGLGDFTLFLSDEGYPTVGLDISRDTVEQLRARFPNADFTVGDVRTTGLEAASFDGVFSWGVFEHFENGPGDCLAEAYRVLRPGGLLFVSTPMDNLRHALRAVFSVRQGGPLEGGQRFYQYRFTPGELSDHLRRGGFEVLEARPIHKRQGVLRALHHELGLPYGWLLTRGLAAMLAPALPGALLAHMVLVVARKPQAGAAALVA